VTVDPDALLLEVLDEIPVEYRDRYASLARREYPDRAGLTVELAAYTRMVRQVATFVTALDPDTADRIAATCSRLVERFPRAPQAGLVAALVIYFVEEDEDDEVTGVLGFDDDIQVANAVCRALDAYDLVLPLAR